MFTGSKVFCWDVNQCEVVSTLDCANIIPAVDSHKIHKLKRFEGKACILTLCIQFTSTWGLKIYEPPHDKTNKMTMPSEDSDQPGHPPSLIRVLAVC